MGRKEKTPTELRVLGNQHFQKGYLREAGRYYSKALEHSDIATEPFVSDKISCLSNRAEVHLREESWQEAAKDAQCALTIQSDHTKAKFRLAKAWSRTGKAQDALVLLKELTKSGGGDALGRSYQVQELIKDCQRIAKEERGEYDIPSMMKEAFERPGFQRLSLFHATYCSAKIDIGVPIKNHVSSLDGGEPYRGCVALSDLKEGELIMSSKAFAMGLKRSIGIMMEDVMQKLCKTPSLGKEFFSLSDGREDHDDDDYVYDENDVCKIFENHDRIRDIVKINAFSMLPYDETILTSWNKLQHPSKRFESPLFSAERVFGLHINESMLNNSCTPNCQWLHIGDQIFIYTTKPVQAGEELCIHYHSTYNSYEERFDRFSNWNRPGVGFECVCDHCKLLRNRKDLFELGNELHFGVRQYQAMEVPGRRITTVQAMQAVFPSSRREAIFSAFSHLPLRLQHTQIANLHAIEGYLLAATEGDLEGALRENILAAKINYEVRGSGQWLYFTDQWCITGLAIACKQCDLARECLEKIWKSPPFQAFPKKEAALMFEELTRTYVIALNPPLDPQYESEIETQIGPLIDLVVNE